jgi:hypothetical protein
MTPGPASAPPAPVLLSALLELLELVELLVCPPEPEGPEVVALGSLAQAVNRPAATKATG